MSFFKKLFGGGGGAAATARVAEPELHKDFRIFAEPVKVSGGYRVAARIERDIDGAVRTHQMIRADVCDSEQEARDHATRKARLLIDQQGASLFRE